MRSFVRLFQKRKSYYITNVAGLAIGLAAAGFSILYFQHELSYDSFHGNSDKIYRVSYKNDAGWFASFSAPHSNALAQDTVPEVEDIARVRRWQSKFVFVGDQKFYESKVLITEPGTHLFKMFSFPFKEGDPGKALASDNSVIISTSLARKYFGDKPALGEPLKFDTIALTVTGVFRDLPTNTSFNFEMMIVNRHVMELANGVFTFVQLRDNADPHQLESKLLRADVGPARQNVLDVKLLPIEDLHFDGNLTFEMKPAGSRSYLWILGAIGTTILVIAFTNFINLSIALYARRSREIAVRKSVGATSTLLSRQFYLESIATISVSFLLALVTIYLLMPALDRLLEIKPPNPLTSVPFVVIMALLLPAMSLLAGAYPAFILPRIHILDLFRQTGIATNHGLRLRMLLLGFQLVVLFFVCCALWVVHEQFQFIKNKDLGFNQHGVIKIKRAWGVDSTLYQTFKTRLLRYSAIEAVSEGYAPGDEDYGFQFRAEGAAEIMEGALSHGTDYDYLTVLGIRPIAGAIATNDRSSLPAKSVVINETMGKMLGYKDPVGRSFVFNPGSEYEKTLIIDGVVADYNFNSLHTAVTPQVLHLYQVTKYVDESILVKVNTVQLAETVKYIQATIDELAPQIPLEITFMEDALNRLYKQETTLSKVVTILVTISLLLSIVGLVALCSYMIEFRQREIAIRKVLGAATTRIIVLFIKSFLGTTLGAFVVAAPICYISMNNWMQSFAYREEIHVSWFVVVLIGVLVIIIGLAVAQTARAANLNPTKVLKE
jgi:putative ABC transport system permease protein